MFNVKIGKVRLPACVPETPVEMGLSAPVDGSRWAMRTPAVADGAIRASALAACVAQSWVGTAGRLQICSVALMV